MAQSDNAGLVRAFLALQLSGAIAFSLIVVSACIFRGTTKRHPIWFSFGVSWIVFGTSYAFLFIAGQQHENPAWIPCTIQSALIYAAPFLVMGSSVGLVAHLLLNVLSALSRSPKHQKPYRTLTVVLIFLPWVTWISVLVGFLVYSFSHRTHVTLSPNRTYCVIRESIIPKVTAVSATIASATIIILEIAIAVLLYRNRGIVNIFSQALSMAIRILIFTILGFGALCLGLVFTVTRSRGVQFDLIIAILPPSAALTFGAQMDILRGWLFWKQPNAVQQAEPDQSIALTTVNSISSQVAASIRQERPSQLSPVAPTPRSFLRF